MINRKDLLNRSVKECLTEMYRQATPSADFSKYGTDPDFYKHYYLSNKKYKEIIDQFMRIYRLNSFEESVNYLTYCIKMEYKELRAENIKVIEESSIKEEPLLNLIQEIYNKYEWKGEESWFRMEVMRISPNSNKETVIEYWKNNGKNINIDD